MLKRGLKKMLGSSIVLYCLLCILTDILRCLKLYLLLVSKLCFIYTFLPSLIFMCLLCAYIWFLMLMDMYIFIHENNWFYQMISLKSVSLSLFLQAISRKIITKKIFTKTWKCLQKTYFYLIFSKAKWSENLFQVNFQ